MWILVGVRYNQVSIGGSPDLLLLPLQNGREEGWKSWIILPTSSIPASTQNTSFLFLLVWLWMLPSPVFVFSWATIRFWPLCKGTFQALHFKVFLPILWYLHLHAFIALPRLLMRSAIAFFSELWSFFCVDGLIPPVLITKHRIITLVTCWKGLVGKTN